MHSERTGWGIRRLLPGSLARRPQTSRTYMVSRKVLTDTLPSTPISQRLAAALEQAAALPIEKLVSRVAGELYDEELRKGAGVLDIGLFGSRLFDEDVLRELHAGDGIFWNIEKPDKA